MQKRTLLASVALAALLAACGKTEPAASTAPAAAPAPAAVVKLVVGLDDNFPPMGFRDEKNELVGFDIDMAREAAKRAGLEVEFKPIDWSAKEAELSGKRVDALWNGLTITEERKQNIAFTAPYMENHQIIVVRPILKSKPRPIWRAKWSVPKKAPARWMPSRKKKLFSIRSKSSKPLATTWRP